MFGRPGVTGGVTGGVNGALRTFTAHVSVVPPLVTVSVFRPVEAKLALKPVPVGFAMVRTGDDHVYVPLPPDAETVAVCPSITFWVPGEQTTAPVVGALATVKVQLEVRPALVTVIVYVPAFG